MFAFDISDALQVSHTLLVYTPGSFIDLREGGRLSGPSTRPETGVVVSSTTDNPSDALADAIIKELTTRGFDAARGDPVPFSAEITRPYVWITVDPRPEGPQGEFKLRAEAEKKKQASSTQVANP
jgi:hypothetical protein